MQRKLGLAIVAGMGICFGASDLAQAQATAPAGSIKVCILKTPTWQSITAVPQDWVLENCQSLPGPVDGGGSNTARAGCVLSTAGKAGAEVISLGRDMGLNWGLAVAPYGPRENYFPKLNCGWK